MTTEQKIDLLLSRGITKTEFKIIRVAVTPEVGITLGQGGNAIGCKAVILRLNQYERNSTNGTLQGVEQMYYGDAQSQEFELLRGVDSELIFCNNLQEVFVRTPTACTVQILLYK